ncbi:MAG: hypothetical protein WCD44_01725 [Candidatus Babeliales bacterium]|jgi:hypothetical protein
MKKIKTSYLLGLLLLGASNINTTTIVTLTSQKPAWKQFFQQYITSIGVGTIVGLSVDVFTEYFFGKLSDEKSKTIGKELMLWVIQSYIKNKLLLDIGKDMRRYNIPHKDSLMFWTAWLTPCCKILKRLYFCKYHRYQYCSCW